MSYIVTFDDASGKYLARKPKTYYPVGEGNSLYSAVDDLERKLSGKTKSRDLPINKPVVCSKCGKSIAPIERNYPLSGIKKENHDEILCASCFAKTTLSITKIQRK